MRPGRDAPASRVLGRRYAPDLPMICGESAPKARPRTASAPKARPRTLTRGREHLERRRSRPLRALLAQGRAAFEPRTTSAAQTVHADATRRDVPVNGRAERKQQG